MTIRLGVIAMILFAKILNGLAQESNAPAVIEDLFAPPLPATNTAPKLVSSLEVRTYRIEGDIELPPAEFGMLSNYTGRVDLNRVQQGLDKIQVLLQQAGYSNAAVTVPDQRFTNGLVRVEIVETNTPVDLSAEVTNLFTVPGPTINIRGYRIDGNTVLSVVEFNFLTNYTGDINFRKLREGLGRLQLRYRELGYATVSVKLPQQKLTNGIVRVKIIEGRLSAIIVESNHYYSTNNILRALPDLATNILLNTKWFQPELDLANANRDRQIYPVISPGLEPGTTELELKVKDRLPLHGRVEVNDKASPDTPLLRLDTALQYDNLWQRDQQVGVDYNFSPQSYKPPGSVSGFYDEPEVTSYSGFYRIPFGLDGNLREDLEQEPATFGFDEVSHKFNLPPPTGKPDLTFYASRSASAIPVRYGPSSVIFTNALANISQQSGEESFTFNNNIGARFNIPLQQFAGISSAFSFGADYKSYSAPTFYTNLTYFALYSLDSFGNSVLVTNETVRLPSNSRAALQYIPLSYSWAAQRPDKTGGFAFNYSQSVFLESLSSPRSGFQAVAGAPGAGGNYTTVNAGLVREQNLWGGWSALLNANGQWASAPLISNEQFALGGTGGVRGYEEAEIYGDTGWRLLFDLRAPAVNVGSFPTSDGEVPAELRCSVLMDYGQTSLIDRPTTENLTFPEWGTGFGCLLTIGEHFDARLTMAWALQGTPTTKAGNAHAYFSIGAQF